TGYLQWFRADGSRRRGLWLAAIALGLTTTMKGPIALLLPSLFVPLHLLAAGRLELRRPLPWGAVALALLLGASWFVYACWRGGAAFAATSFGQHICGRFSTDDLGSRGALYYPPVFLLDILPWGAALPGALWVGWRQRLWRREPWRSAVLWSALLLLFFSIS